MRKGKTMKNNQRIRVSTGFNQEYAKSVLTTDINCKDSLFDLVDNSIDAARIVLVGPSNATDPDFVHESYEGFEVSIGVHENEIWLEDNCSGIGRDDIESRLLVVGEKPTQPMAIGRSEEHTSELQSRGHLVCRLLLEKKKQ